MNEKKNPNSIGNQDKTEQFIRNIEKQEYK